MNTSCAASVIIATHNRSAALLETLDAFTRLSTAEQWELIVVENGGSPDNDGVLEQYKVALPLKPLFDPRASKSCAVNRALEAVQGRMILFTDDDASVSPHWLDEYLRASRSYATARVFCGPVVPRYPVNTPPWLQSHTLAGPAFARFMPDLPEGLLPGMTLPFGANFAASAEAISGLRFNEELGPSRQGLLGEDTQFLRTLRSRGEEIVFVPRASVLHRISGERITLAWLLDRALSYGRSVVAESGQVLIGHAGGEPEREGLSADQADFERGVQLNFYVGQLSQLAASGRRDECDKVRTVLAAMLRADDERLLAPAAAKFLCEDSPLAFRSAGRAAQREAG